MTFGILWEITLGSWMTAAMLLLFRLALGRWVRPRWRVLLWLLLLLRLLPIQLLPIPIIPLQSPVSLMRYAPDPETAAEHLAPAVQMTAAAAIGNAGFQPVLRTVWLLGVGAVLLAWLILYLLALRRLRALPPCGDLETEREYLRLKQSCHPGFNPRLVRGSRGMLGGFFRPVLVIPSERTGGAAAPILLHELMHYRGGDLWLTLLFRLFCAVYWFNPVLWFCSWLMRRDEELACGERVLDTALVSPKAYAGALLEEYELRGSPDPMPLTRFGAAGVKRRIREILRYRKPNRGSAVLPALLGLAVLALAALSPYTGRSYGFDRTIPAMVGWQDAETYIRALQPSLGAFGMTHSQLVESGYLGKDEGTWVSYGSRQKTLSVVREWEEGTLILRYVFKTTLYTENSGTMVLTEIQGVLPPKDADFDWKYRAIGRKLLESSPELNDCHALYEGNAEDLLRSDRSTDWGLVDWLRTQEALQEYYLALTALGYKASYSVRCTPVTLGDCLTPEEMDSLAERIVDQGWVGDTKAGEELIRGWHLMGLASLTTWDHWSLVGAGIALYETRPGNP